MHTFEISGFSPKLRVHKFEGHEGISRLYQFEVDVVATENDLDFESALGKPAMLTFRGGEEARSVHGLVAAFEQGNETKRMTTYRITVVPHAWLLQHRKNSRIFQEKSVPDILKLVLEDAGLEHVTFKLRGSYAKREYCVQYRESDWAFACRLMEHEGIYFYFEHGEENEALVLADDASGHEAILGESSVAFRTPTGALAAKESVSSFRFGERIRPGKVSLTDYDFKRPNTSLAASKSASKDTNLEIYDYPGDYEVSGTGTKLAEVRLAELQATKKTGAGEASCARFVAGMTFTMTDHARADLNRKWLLTVVVHKGAEAVLDAATTDDVYSNRFEVMPADVPYRPPHVTPRPAIKGVQTALVVGPAGEEIHTDSHGRIKVQFHWDRAGKKDDKSSCWIRVAQTWSGSAWGAVFLPRVGHEVVVDFLEGDPDRPLVVGSVYNGVNPPPYALPGEKTKSTTKTNSSPGGGGFNELRFEDKKGSEEIFLHGEKDWNIVIKHDKTQQIGNDETLSVDHDRTKTIKNDQTETISGKKTTEVKLDHEETIHGNQTVTVDKEQTITVKGGLTLDVTKDHSETIGGNQSIGVSGQLDIAVDRAMSVNVGAGLTETITGSSGENVSKTKTLTVDENYNVTVSKEASLTVTKNYKEEIKEEKTLIVGKKLSVQCGDATITVEKDGTVTVQGKKIIVKGGGPIEVSGKKLEIKSEGAVNVEASGKIQIKGSNVGMN